MSRNYSVFVDDKYYYDFIVLYNSWKYYNNKIPIKVYIPNNTLSKENRYSLEKIVEVINVPIGDYTTFQFHGKLLFKWIALSNYMADNEILLDADTMFLSNIDYLFDYIENGKLIGAREAGNTYHRLYSDNWDEEYFILQDELKKYIGSAADNFTYDLFTPIYNTGMIGFNKNKHLFLLKKCVELLSSNLDSKINPRWYIINSDQFTMNLLLQLYSVDIHELSQTEWMNTWFFHKDPKKIIKINNGKFELHNENGKKINFYHFTGGIGMPYEKENNILYACRMHQLYKSDPVEPQFERKDVEKLWYEIHENPVLLLYEFFYNKGI